MDKNTQMFTQKNLTFSAELPKYKVDFCQTGLRIIGNIFFWFCAIVAFILIAFSSVTIECPISGTSMIPTFNRDAKNGEDTVYINIYYRDFKYGDIVVVDRNDAHLYPEINVENTSKSLPLIKRIIGLPGDKIDIVYDKDEETYFVERNGDRLNEDYINIKNELEKDKRNGIYATFNEFQNLKISKPNLFENGKLVVPENEIFVLGDNRHVSLDSSHYGTFLQSDIEGVVDQILYSGQSKFAFFWNYIFSGDWIYTFENCFKN